MRSQDVTIPLALWICAAICAHFFFGTGGLVVAQVHDDRSEMWRLSRQASRLAQRDEQTFEVSLNEPSEESTEQAPPPPPPPKPEEPKPPPVPTEKAPENTPPKPQDAKSAEEKRAIVLKKEKDEKKSATLPDEALKDRRIAVRQHAQPNQEDNPSAKFIADEANHVDKETVASQTSHDRDDEKPTPGGNHPGSDKQVGDSEKTRIAESEEHEGVKNRAPGERGTDFDVVHEPKLPKPVPMGASAAQPEKAPQQAATNESSPSPPAQAQPNQPTEAAPGGATPPSPDVTAGSEGVWSFNPARTGGAAGTTPQPRAGSADSRLPGGRMWSLPGLGQKGSPGTVNMNLNQGQIATIVGIDNLRKLREADGERRKSEHRGSWVASNFDRWRSAIENYVSSVKPGNQTALNTAQSPFALYLNGMHNRIHPIFAESFLESLDGLPSTHPMNDKHLVTQLEIVLTKEGHLKKMGVVRTSGITAFDVAALDAVDRAQPFGPVPGAIISADGNVYLHWEFHRDQIYACSTMGARPFLLTTPARSNDPPAVPPTSPSPEIPTREHGPPSSPNDAREGLLEPAVALPPS